MISRHPSHGQKLDVAGLNEITVLIDRSETALTEVAINSWTPGLNGPPHFHDRKEQNFLVISGRGEVTIEGERYPAKPGSFFYVPAGNIHQTINRDPLERLDYFLFNAFLDDDKEGHVSFADHIDKVKGTRRQQADEQKADLNDKPTPSGKKPKQTTLPTDDSSTPTTLLDRNKTQRCEALMWRLAAAKLANLEADDSKEQTLYVVAGSGTIRIGDEQADVIAGHTLLVPPGAICSLEASTAGLQVVSFGTVLKI